MLGVTMGRYRDPPGTSQISSRLPNGGGAGSNTIQFDWRPPDLGNWLVARDRGIFSFGAPFYGSTGALSRNNPSRPDTDARRWRLLARGIRRGIFAFGD